MFKRLFCFLLIIITACVPFSALAADTSAFLSDAITEKNSIFETVLSVNTEVSAFVATLSFDEKLVEFRSAKASSEHSEISINTQDKGKVTLAFVNKYGVKGEIISLMFKSKTDNTFIGLSLEQVIGKNTEDIILTSVKGAQITIILKSTDKSENKGNNPTEEKSEITSAEALSEENSTLSINIPAKETSKSDEIIIISSGVVLVVSVGVMGFIIGRKTDNKNRKNKYEKNS